MYYQKINNNTRVKLKVFSTDANTVMINLLQSNTRTFYYEIFKYIYYILYFQVNKSMIISFFSKKGYSKR